MTDLPTYVIDRTFNAPQVLVWRAWTDPKLLPRWYGPRVETNILTFDLKPGGLWHTEMVWDGVPKYDRVEFLEVNEPERLVWLHSPADKDGNVAGNPMMPNWPKYLHTTVTFTEIGDQTQVRLIWVPHQASEAEITCFANAIGNLDAGWGAGFDLLQDVLADLQVD